MVLTRVGHISSGLSLLDTNLRDLQVVTMASGTYLYTTTGRNGGLTAYRLDAAGGLATVIDSQIFVGASAVGAAGVAAPVSINGALSLVFGTTSGQGLLSYNLDSAGQMTTLATIGGSPSGLAHSLSMTSMASSGGTFVYTVNEVSGRLETYRIATNGQFEQINSTNTASLFTVSGDTQMRTVTIGTAHYVLATDQATQGVLSFAANPTTGALQLAGQMGSAWGIGISTPTAMEVVTAFGQTFVIVAGAGSNSLSVMRMAANGSLEPTDHILDTLHTRFTGAQSMAIAQSGDRVFVVIGGADDGLSVFTLLPNGDLLHIQTIAHTQGAGLMNVEQITAAVVGNSVQIFVTSGVDIGITQYSLNIGTAGIVIVDIDRRETTLMGTTGNDILVGGDRRVDTLFGGAGDDILVGGPTAVDLYGGAGRDIFMVTESAALTRIMDFQPGIDTIDMSNYLMLRSAGQLNIMSTAFGAIITMRRATIEVHGMSPGALTVTDLFGTDFAWPDRVLVLADEPEAPPPPPPPDPNAGVTLRGGSGNDTLFGGGQNDDLGGAEGDDLLYGFGGADTLTGEGGADIFFGGDGNDVITGGAGRDQVFGGYGNDSIDGGADADYIKGGAGNDTLAGGDGNDVFSGGAGNDAISGGEGSDFLLGGDGNDTLYGGGGNDLILGGGGGGADWIYGGDGHDLLWGDDGNDRIWGGAGNDLISGGTGNDSLYGDDGNDLIWASFGDDYAEGGAGDDQIMGQTGNDTLFGGNGADQLWGGAGNDQLFGDSGNDTLSGGDGNDLLMGGAGFDVLRGGAGNDTLLGGADNDWMTGGAGADVFWFSRNEGTDYITDFVVNVDRIEISGSGQNFATLAITQSFGNTLITFGTGQIHLMGVNMATLDADDFIFS